MKSFFTTLTQCTEEIIYAIYEEVSISKEKEKEKEKFARKSFS